MEKPTPWMKKNYSTVHQSWLILKEYGFTEEAVDYVCGLQHLTLDTVERINEMTEEEVKGLKTYKDWIWS